MCESTWFQCLSFSVHACRLHRMAETMFTVERLSYFGGSTIITGGSTDSVHIVIYSSELRSICLQVLVAMSWK